MAENGEAVVRSTAVAAFAEVDHRLPDQLGVGVVDQWRLVTGLKSGPVFGLQDTEDEYLAALWVVLLVSSAHE